MTGSEVLDRIEEAGYLGDVIECEIHESSVSGRCTLALILKLRKDERFAECPFNHLHPNVGNPRTGFRAHRDELGSGSLQLVINKRTGQFEADVDRFPSGSDLVGQVSHLAAEVIWPRITGLFRRKRKEVNKV